MENIDIRNYIIENFKDDNEEKIKNSIETTIKEKDETLRVFHLQK